MNILDMKKITKVGSGIYISKYVEYGDNLFVGHNSIIGFSFSPKDNFKIIIEDNVSIGAFCVIHTNSHIGSNVDIDHYCRVGDGVKIGGGSKILYGTQLFNNCKVGQNCIIGGDLSERVIVEDNVTFMGELAHNHRNPNLDWDTTDEPSPIFRRGTVVGVGAIVMGGISVGPFSYIAAGELVKSDVPPRKVVYKGKISNLEDWKGIIQVRE